MAPLSIRKDKVNWILNCAVRDINFRCALKDLTEQEIRHCIGIEKRVSAIEAIRREARRKGIELTTEVTCPSCGWVGQAKGWKAQVCPRCGKWIMVNESKGKKMEPRENQLEAKCKACGWTQPSRGWKLFVCPSCGKWVKVEKQVGQA